MVRKVKHQNNVTRGIARQTFYIRLREILEDNFNFSIRPCQSFRGVEVPQLCFIALEALLTVAWRAFGLYRLETMTKASTVLNGTT